MNPTVIIKNSSSAFGYFCMLTAGYIGGLITGEIIGRLSAQDDRIIDLQDQLAQERKRTSRSY